MIEHLNERRTRLIGHSGISVSFEFFPPATEKMEHNLWEAISRLAPLEPRFVSVTYGAGGTTRERTHNTVARLLKESTLTPAAHLTCIGATKEDVNAVIRSYHDLGVHHIVALRGDPPEGLEARYQPHPDGYENAADLVAGIRSIGNFDISVSAYPEKHPETANWQAEIDNLARKVDNGATQAITQFFFNNDCYEDYLERVRARGLNIPIIPGIIPVYNFKQIANFAKKCGTKIPNWLAQRFDGLDDDPQTRMLIASAIAAEQVMDLVDRGITDFHFYTMNRADLVFAICHLLGVRSNEPTLAETTEAAA